MPDTGAPWNIPYADSSDLVRDWPDLSEDIAEAVADGLDAAGGLVAVKHALFTGTQTNSTAAGANFAVTDLSITHTLADAANKLVMLTSIGQAESSQDLGVGFAFADDGSLIDIANADGSRRRTTAGLSRNQVTSEEIRQTFSIHTVYAPLDTDSHTYTVRGINISTSTETLYINRARNDTDNGEYARAASMFTLMEVKV
jgi:hypothetical protein